MALVTRLAVAQLLVAVLVAQQALLMVLLVQPIQAAVAAAEQVLRLIQQKGLVAMEVLVL